MSMEKGVEQDRGMKEGVGANMISVSRSRSAIRILSLGAW